MQDPDDPFSLTRCLIYTEHGSKNHPGGSKQLDLANKGVKHFSNALMGDRCHVVLVKKYLAKLPHGALEKDCFYCQLKRSEAMIYHQKLRGMTTNQLGTNVLKGKLREMFQSAGLQAETKSNYSLRASGISRLYSAGVPEKLIVERSGHLSKEGVRSYERTTAQQHKTVSDWLTNPKVPMLVLWQQNMFPYKISQILHH